MFSKELTMQEIQSVSLEILKKVADICEEQHLHYFLAYGTLIGAVRHKDYIPFCRRYLYGKTIVIARQIRTTSCVSTR